MIRDLLKFLKKIQLLRFSFGLISASERFIIIRPLLMFKKYYWFYTQFKAFNGINNNIKKT